MMLFEFESRNASFCLDEIGLNQTNHTGVITESAEIRRVKFYSYAIVMPCVILLGVVGNIASFIALTKQNMKGTAYIYMKGNKSYVILFKMCCRICGRSLKSTLKCRINIYILEHHSLYKIILCAIFISLSNWKSHL